jgi:hypothetical protein
MTPRGRQRLTSPRSGAWARLALFALAFACGIAVTQTLPPAASARFLKAYADPGFDSSDTPTRQFLFEQSARANANLARINVVWRSITSARPAEPENPSDPAYQFDRLDQAVLDAAASGHAVVLTVYEAPDWAEGPNRPPGAEYPTGTWKPDPEALGQFAQALASRYSGTFSAAGLTALPRVAYFEVWNEPNLSEYITPQSVDGRLYSPGRFREMLNSFAAGVARSSNPDAKIVTGGTAPYGDPIGGRRTRPLRFWREVFCLNERLERAGKCGGKADFDILAHHPITFSGGPNRSAIHPDDAAMPDFKNVIKTLRAAERRNTVRGGKHPAWATEYWWESTPPDPTGFPVAKQARWVEESLYLLWRQGASAAIWLQLVDNELHENGVSGLQGGHFYLDRSEKPSFRAFRFPFVADRISKKKLVVWTIPPGSGTLEIQEKRGGDFKTVRRMSVADGKPKQTRIGVKSKAKLRGMLNGETSLTYRVG